MKKYLIAAAVVAASLSAQAKDIVDTAVSAGNFKTLATALQAAIGCVRITSAMPATPSARNTTVGIGSSSGVRTAWTRAHYQFDRCRKKRRCTTWQ